MPTIKASIYPSLKEFIKKTHKTWRYSETLCQFNLRSSQHHNLQIFKETNT